MAPRRKRHEVELKGGESGLGRWLLTYADLITLLMLFFIVMYAMSVVDQKKLEALADSLMIGFHSGTTPLELQQQGALRDAAAGRERYLEGTRRAPAPVSGKWRVEAYRQARSFFQPEIGARKLRVIEEERGLVIQIGADSFFGPGSADFGIDAARVLERVAEFVGGLPNPVRIEGHTDNTPVGAGPFPSNWELSSQRAINILKALTDYGLDETHLSATAYGPTRPIAANDTPEGRAYNRRVDIVVLAAEQ
jgi:chemotaxis protein MotB